MSASCQTKMLLCLVLWSLVHTAQSIFPRIRLSYAELWQMNRTVLFHAEGSLLQPQAMLLDEPNERLYVGAKNSLFSLGLDRINTDHKEIQWASTETQMEECMMKGREKPECANYIKVLQKYNETHLLACGTGAFNPVCGLISAGRTGTDRLFSLAEESVESGRGRCPYNPSSPCSSTLSGGELYVGLYADYWENDGAVSRLNSHTYTRTERGDRQQLNQPKFVKSALIPDSEDREDDKVYFFFTERGQNPEGEARAVYTRVGRVCANDQGGQRMLVNRWSSFLKTRLVCSVAGANGIDTHFDELEDVFVLKNKDEKNPEVFGLFSTTSAVFQGYAVCVYQMEDIRASFNGPFAQRERPGHHWTPYGEKVPFPRPGSCASKMAGAGFSSSKEFPDEVLRFVRAHPLMYQAVQPMRRRPILLQTEPRRRLTQLAVDRVQAQDGHYHVLYIGTDDSVVLKVITIYNKDTDAVEEVLLEELQVFQVPVPITEIIISSKRQQLYVGSEVGVAQVRLHQCELYGSQCADCCLARDPYCAWDGLTCSRYYPAGVYTKSRRYRRQDVRHGNAVQLCNGLQIDDQQWGGAEERQVYGVESNSTVLPCTPRSLQARVQWFRQIGEEREELQANERVIMTTHGLLFLHTRVSDAGVYICQAVEHGYVHTLQRIVLHVLKGERARLAASHGNDEGDDAERGGGERAAAPRPSSCPGAGPRTAGTASAPAFHARLWYKEFLQLIGYGDAQRVEEYCERVWCSDPKRRKAKRRYLTPGGERRGKGKENSHRAPRHTVMDT